MILIIAEKNLAGERIAQILGGKTTKQQARGFAKYYSFSRNGNEHVVVPLRGHIVEVDFPRIYSNWRGTELTQLVSAPILYAPSDPAIANLLREMGKLATQVVIATDADREGESIGVESLRIVQETNSNVPVKRAYFSAMTPKELVKSFDELVGVDYNLSDSADSRREIDLVWGAVLTRFVSIMSGRMGKDFISVGRVQTPLLALIVNREKERLAFVVQSYWEILAQCEKDQIKFEAAHKMGKFWDEKKVIEVFTKVKDAKTAKVMKVTTRKKNIPRPIPFNTTQLLRSATGLGMSASLGMSVAESLYMSGYISYPRTDNTVYPATLDLRELLLELKNYPEYAPFVDEILSKPLNPSRGDKETPDHPPVHPTKVPDKKSLDEKAWKMFDLVARRFLATFMPDAQTENVSVDLDIKAEPFSATGQTILFAGWKAVYPFSVLEEKILPALKEGDVVDVSKIDMPRKETQPPARYSQSALLKLMEELNLGTKCLHGGTLVKVFNSGKTENVSMQNIFESANSVGMLDDSAEIKENISFDCLGVSVKGAVEKNRFPMVSRRPIKVGVDFMKRITFSDGSILEATDNHPIFCLENSEMSFVPISSIKVQTETISYHTNSTESSYGIISWSEFLSLCKEDTCLFGHEVSTMLYTQRKGESLSMLSFASKYGGYQGNYVAYERGTRPVPLKILQNTGITPSKISGVGQDFISNPFPMAVNASLARILAKLIGDGSLDTKKVAKENCYDFRYTNTNPELLSEFANDIEKIFNVAPKLYSSKPKKEWHKDKMAIKLPGAIGRIIATLFPDVLQKRPWNNLPSSLYPDFIGAFLDDEGHIVKKETKLFLSNTNHETLKDLQKMLSHLNIVSRLDVKQHKLYVSQRKSLFNFLEKIPITSTYKKKRLIEMLSKSYSYTRSKKPFFIAQKEILCALKLPKTSEEVSIEVNLSKQATRGHIKRLLIEKKVKKIVDGNNKDIVRRVRYVSITDLPNSAYALLGETCITSKLVTKTVTKIENIPLPAFVYDLTNSEEKPAFVLQNNVIVHNSTRAEMFKKLYERQYISGLKSIEPNQIAFAVIDSLEKHCRIVTEPKMTAEMELEMDEVAQGKKKKEKVVDESRVMLTTVLTQLLANKMAISGDLKKALFHQDSMGTCPHDGGNLVVRKALATGKRFLGCANYPNCKTTFPLPQKGTLYPANKICSVCNAAPLVKLAGKKFKMEICVNYHCPSKDAWKKQMEEKAAAGPAPTSNSASTPTSTWASASAPKPKPKAVRKSKSKSTSPSPTPASTPAPAKPSNTPPVKGVWRKVG